LYILTCLLSKGLTMFKTVNTSELQGVALDWAVAKCDGGEGLFYDTVATYWIKIDGEDRALSKGWAQSFTPSTNWAQGGPIIERENMTVGPNPFGQGCVANKGDVDEYGPTPLIAAMRCYVASKLGDTLEIPAELL
jgi:hypothetical protein